MLTLLLACGLPPIALAAPFCLNFPGGTSQCVYSDGPQCAKEAAKQSGSCTVNPREVTTPTGTGFCLITGEGAVARCGYADGLTCARDAILQKGNCLESKNQYKRQVPDDYQPNVGR